MPPKIRLKLPNSSIDPESLDFPLLTQPEVFRLPVFYRSHETALEWYAESENR